MKKFEPINVDKVSTEIAEEVLAGNPENVFNRSLVKIMLEVAIVKGMTLAIEDYNAKIVKALKGSKE